MSLELPSDIEPFLNAERDDWTNPAVYCLALTKPDNMAEAWDREFDHQPDYMADLEDCEQVVYVGGANNLIHRLEDHRNADVRKSALMEVCEIDYLRNVWWMDSTEKAFLEESRIATLMQNQHPEMYVHQR